MQLYRGNARQEILVVFIRLLGFPGSCCHVGNVLSHIAVNLLEDTDCNIIVTLFRASLYFLLYNIHQSPMEAIISIPNGPRF